MSLGDKTYKLISAADSDDTTPGKMKSMINEVKSDPELVYTGAVLPMLQLALQAALTPGNDDDSERRLGVLKTIACALAENYGREYLHMFLKQTVVARGNPESLIGKILGE